MKDFILRCHKLDEDIKCAEGELNIAKATILKGQLRNLQSALQNHKVSNCIRTDTLASRKTPKTSKSHKSPNSPKSPKSHFNHEIDDSPDSQQEDSITCLRPPTRSPKPIESLQNSLLNLNITQDARKKALLKSETLSPSRVSLIKRQKKLAAARARREERKAKLILLGRQTQTADFECIGEQSDSESVKVVGVEVGVEGYVGESMGDSEGKFSESIVAGGKFDFVLKKVGKVGVEVGDSEGVSEEEDGPREIERRMKYADLEFMEFLVMFESSGSEERKGFWGAFNEDIRGSLVDMARFEKQKLKKLIKTVEGFLKCGCGEFMTQAEYKSGFRTCCINDATKEFANKNHQALKNGLV